MKFTHLFFCMASILTLTNVITLAQDGSTQRPNKPSESIRKRYSTPEAQARAKEIKKLLDQLDKQKGRQTFLSQKDPRRPRSPVNPYTSLLLMRGTREQINKARELSKPGHRPSILAAPASLLGPISLGAAYGPLMFQNSLNQLWQWNGPPLPYNGMAGSSYLVNSGPFYIPYELALQNRLTVTTITDTYGNQLVSVYDNATGFSHSYQVISRLDSSPPPGTASPIYGMGYYVSEYNGLIIGTNTSSMPGYFVPYMNYPTTFGYAGDLDTFGPSGRGHTPLYPAGPPPLPSYAPTGLNALPGSGYNPSMGPPPIPTFTPSGTAITPNP